MSGTTHPQGREPSSSARSSPVNTAITPGDFKASAVSIDFIKACASGLRTKTIWSMPVRVTSSTYVPWPVIRRGSSFLFNAAPNAAVVMEFTSLESPIFPILTYCPIVDRAKTLATSRIQRAATKQKTRPKLV